MRTLFLGTICAAFLAFSYTAKANVIEVSLDPTTHLPSDVNFNDVVGGGNQNDIIFEWLKGEILSYFNNLHVQLPDPTDGLTKFDNLNGVPPAGGVHVEAGDYVVIHYGVGTGGVHASGGGLVAFFFDSAQTFNPDANGSGPNGFGGISFVDVFDHTSVPDGGTTLLLLGTSLVGLALFARARKTASA